MLDNKLTEPIVIGYQSYTIVHWRLIGWNPMASKRKYCMDAFFYGNWCCNNIRFRYFVSPLLRWGRVA